MKDQGRICQDDVQQGEERQGEEERCHDVAVDGVEDVLWEERYQERNAKAFEPVVGNERARDPVGKPHQSDHYDGVEEADPIEQLPSPQTQRPPQCEPRSGHRVVDGKSTRLVVVEPFLEARDRQREHLGMPHVRIAPTRHTGGGTGVREVLGRAIEDDELNRFTTEAFYASPGHLAVPVFHHEVEMRRLVDVVEIRKGGAEKEYSTRGRHAQSEHDASFVNGADHHGPLGEGPLTPPAERHPARRDLTSRAAAPAPASR